MYFVNFLDPFAKMLGLDGFILAAFILGLPANEIVIPILLMSYLSTGALTEIDDFNQIKNLFLENGWTWLTALNTMLFSLLHFPCGTTLVNIYKETKSAKWTFLSFAIPTVIAIVVTFLSTQLVHWLGLIKQSIHRRHPLHICFVRKKPENHSGFFCTSVFHGCAPYVVSFYE